MHTLFLHSAWESTCPASHNRTQYETEHKSDFACSTAWHDWLNSGTLACTCRLQYVLKRRSASLLLFLQVHVNSMLALMCSGQDGGHLGRLPLQTCRIHHGLKVSHLISQQLRSVGLKHFCSQVLLILSHELPAGSTACVKSGKA